MSTIQLTLSGRIMCMNCGSKPIKISADIWSELFDKLSRIKDDNLFTQGICLACWNKWKEHRRACIRREWVEYFQNRVPLPEDYK